MQSNLLRCTRAPSARDLSDDGPLPLFKQSDQLDLYVHRCLVFVRLGSAFDRDLGHWQHEAAEVFGLVPEMCKDPHFSMDWLKAVVPERGS